MLNSKDYLIIVNKYSKKQLEYLIKEQKKENAKLKLSIIKKTLMLQKLESE